MRLACGVPLPPPSGAPPRLERAPSSPLRSASPRAPVGTAEGDVALLAGTIPDRAPRAAELRAKRPRAAREARALLARRKASCRSGPHLHVLATTLRRDRDRRDGRRSSPEA